MTSLPPIFITLSPSAGNYFGCRVLPPANLKPGENRIKCSLFVPGQTYIPEEISKEDIKIVHIPSINDKIVYSIPENICNLDWMGLHEELLNFMYLFGGTYNCITFLTPTVYQLYKKDLTITRIKEEDRERIKKVLELLKEKNCDAIKEHIDTFLIQLSTIPQQF